MNRPDQNRALAFILCSLLFVMWLQSVIVPYFNGPPEGVQGQQAATTTAADNSHATSASSVASPIKQSQVQAAQAGRDAQVIPVSTSPGTYPSTEDIEKAGQLIVENEKFKATFSLLGGRITEFLLKEHNESLEEAGKLLDMVVHEDGPYPAGAVVGDQSDLWVNYSATLKSGQKEVQGNSLKLQGEDGGEILFRGKLDDGREVQKKFSFQGDKYLFDADITASGVEAEVALEWTRYVKASKESMFSQPGGGGVVWHDDDKAHHEEYSDLESDEVKLENLSWVTLGDKYFMSTMISKKPVSGRILHSENDGLVQSQIFGAEAESASFSLYVGPKVYSELEKLGYDLRKNVNFGKTGFVAAPLLWLMHKFFGMLGNYGVAIVLLTILVKAVLFPLNSVAFRNMKAMQDLQPEIQRLREQYKDAQEQQKQIMSLYKRKKVNPLGGCFPMLLQLPIFIGLFSALRLAVELRHAHFAYWINDLSAPEGLEIFGFSVPVMVVLFVASMVIQQWTMPSTMDATQKKVMMVVPILFGFMFAGFPAGLTIYFLTNNLISIGQQRALQKGGDAYAVKVTALVSIALFVFSLLISKLG